MDPRGIIRAAGPRHAITAQAGNATVVDHGCAWLIPGLVDGHSHYPQYYATAMPSADLQTWLNQSIYPEELAYADNAYARRNATGFIAKLLACGTTTAAVFGSQFPAATAALFNAAQSHHLRLIAGLTLMDRSGPAPLLTTAERAYRQCEQLLRRYRDQPRLAPAVIPRFALSCTPALLETCGALVKAWPQLYVHTHINETETEIAATRRLFPQAENYLAVYDRAGLLTPRTLLAHNLHPQTAELERISQAGCSVCHCPSSNLYLGSGLFPLQKHRDAGINLALGTDIGAGPGFSVWRLLTTAFGLQNLQGMHLSAAQLLYLATLGGARALGVEKATGNFQPGKSADFFVLTAERDHYLRQRLQRSDSWEGQLLALIHLAGPGHIRATYADGIRVYNAPDS